MSLPKIEAIYTDATYDGIGWSANGCWSERYVIEIQEDTKDREIVRLGKAAAGLTNVRGTMTNFGDSWMFKPYGSATLLFINIINE